MAYGRAVTRFETGANRLRQCSRFGFYPPEGVEVGKINPERMQY